MAPSIAGTLDSGSKAHHMRWVSLQSTANTCQCKCDACGCVHIFIICCSCQLHHIIHWSMLIVLFYDIYSCIATFASWLVHHHQFNALQSMYVMHFYYVQLLCTTQPLSTCAVTSHRLNQFAYVYVWLRATLWQLAMPPRKAGKTALPAHTTTPKASPKARATVDKTPAHQHSKPDAASTSVTPPVAKRRKAQQDMEIAHDVPLPQYTSYWDQFAVNKCEPPADAKAWFVWDLHLYSTCIIMLP